MLCCLIQCFKVGCIKQRRLATPAFVIFTGFFLILQNLSPAPQLQTKSLENGEIGKNQRHARRHLSDDKENEDDIKRNGKQETIRKLRLFAKGLQKQQNSKSCSLFPTFGMIAFLIRAGATLQGKKEKNR